jgi:type I restriction enzyme S subunit
MIRLRYLAQINPPTPAFNQIADDTELTFLPMEAVWPGARLDISQRRMKEAVAVGYTRFRNGDVLLPKITPTFEAGRAVLINGLVGGVGAGTTELHVLRPEPQIEPRFLLYLVSTHKFLRLGEAEMYGVAGQRRVPDEFLRNLPVHLPSLEEQRRIADFLDAETARIDQLVAAKKQVSALIDERRVALTSQAALRGLDEAAPVRESGIGQLGPVPSHWLTKRNKTFMREVADLSEDGTEELLTVSHLTGVTPRAEKTVYMFKAESMVGYKKCRSGDLVINTLWAWMGALGVSRNDGIVSPAYGVYRFVSEDVLPEYVDLLFRTPEYVVEMTRYSKGVWTSRLRLYPESFLALRTPIPPLEEQKAIVAMVRQETAPGVRLQEAIQQSNQLLAERRQALITAAVTGQIDVSTASGRGVTEGVSA